jgi:hypothetical protein
MPKRPKQIPKDPAQLENLWGEMNSEHFESYRNARQFVEKLLDKEKQQLEKGTFDLETQTIEPYTPDLRSVLALISAVRLCVDGERTSLNLELLSDQRAIAKVQQLGFILQLPDGSVALDS